MAETIVVCPQCTARLKLKGGVAGKKVKCPGCQGTFRINAADATAPQPFPADGIGGPALSSEAPSRRRNLPRDANSRPEVRRRTASNSPASAAQKPAKKRRKKKSAPDNFYADGAFEEFDDFGDDVGDDFTSAYDDGYQDYGDTRRLPGRRKKKKKPSGQKKKAAVAAGSLQESVSQLGVVGWGLFAAAGGLISIFLTTLVGLADIWLLISCMSLVTGVLVGAGVRFAADHNQGWGPGLLAGAVALACILAGRVGAFYVADEGKLFGDDDGWTLQDTIDESTTENAMISDLADTVNTEWLESGQITQAQLEAHDQQLELDYEENYEEDYEEGEEYDYAVDYLPEVWAEATSRWTGKTAAEREQAIAQKAQEVRDEWGEVEDVIEDVASKFRLYVAIALTVFSLFATKSGFVMFVMGVWAAFRIGSNLGDDE